MYKSQFFQQFPTWMWEIGVAAAWLFVVTMAATNWGSLLSILVQFFSFWGVLFSFAYVQVSTRLVEEQSLTPKPTVACHQKLLTYLLAKEAMWFLAFLIMGAWTAIGGQLLFALYPWWRKHYRSF